MANQGRIHQGLAEQNEEVESGNISDVHVATFGSNMAVAQYKFSYDADIKGTHRARAVICSSDTWVNESGNWKSAAAHCSLVQGK
jgi:hypothetical protein